MPQRALGLRNFVLVVGELQVISDLMFHSRIESAARAAGADLVRVDSPAQVPADVDLVLVDWSAREPDWTDPLRGLRAGSVRLILLPAVVGVRSARGDARRSATRRGPPHCGDMMGGSGSGTEMRVPMWVWASPSAWGGMSNWSRRWCRGPDRLRRMRPDDRARRRDAQRRDRQLRDHLPTRRLCG